MRPQALGISQWTLTYTIAHTARARTETEQGQERRAGKAKEQGIEDKEQERDKEIDMGLIQWK